MRRATYCTCGRCSSRSLSRSATSTCFAKATVAADMFCPLRCPVSNSRRVSTVCGARLQSVPDAPHRVNQLVFARCVHLLAQTIDVHVHHARSLDQRDFPDLLDDFGTRHALSGVAHQVFQQRKLLRREIGLSARPLHRTLKPAQLEVLDAQHGFRMVAPAAKYSAYPCGKLGKYEWFEQQIVCAHIEQWHAILSACPARQNQDRQLLLSRAKTPEKLDAIVLPQMKIQNGGIVMPVAGQRLDFSGVGRQIDYVVFGTEFHLQKNAERQVAFSDKDTHDCSNGRGDYEGMFNL